ncbi:helix-turn-helix transcriptional regulator [Natrialba aegyptia]|nr:winged helix-turn-helix domain-containing protein [Natrialba aegyptia]
MECGSELRTTLNKRYNIMKSISEGARTKPEITENVEVSRSTVDRAIDKLQELDCTEQTGGTYQLTVKGQMAYKSHTEYIELINKITNMGDVINEISNPAMVNREFIRHSIIYESKSQVPESSLKRVREILESTSKIYGLAPIHLPTYRQMVMEAASENGLNAVIISQSCILQELFEAIEEEMLKFTTHENIHVFSIDESLPFPIWIMETDREDYAVLAVNGVGGIEATLINENDDGIKWAKSVINEYMERSSIIEERESYQSY